MNATRTLSDIRGDLYDARNEQTKAERLWKRRRNANDRIRVDVEYRGREDRRAEWERATQRMEEAHAAWLQATTRVAILSDEERAAAEASHAAYLQRIENAQGAFDTLAADMEHDYRLGRLADADGPIPVRPFLHVRATRGGLKVSWLPAERGDESHWREHTFDVQARERGWSGRDAGPKVTWAAWGSSDLATTRDFAIALRLAALVGEVADNAGLRDPRELSY